MSVDTAHSRHNRHRARRTRLFLVLVLLFAPFANAANTTPNLLQDVGIEQHLDEPLPLDLAFRDEGGRQVKLGDYFGGKPVILTLVYYECPMLCSLVLKGLVSSLRALSFDVGAEFEIVTVSFDQRDTPAVAAAKKESYLQEYARPGAEAGWHFLTGDADSIERLTRAVGFRYAWDEEHEQFAHAAGIMVVTPKGKLARYFYGVEYAPRDLRLALIEASKNRIGTVVDQLLLYCFHYDPATGRYGAVVMNLVRLGGALTLLALATFVIAAWRRDTAKARRTAEAG